MSDQPVRLGLVGLGAIGSICGEHLLRKNASLGVYDRDTQRMQELVDHGAVPHPTARALGAASEIVVVSLPNPDAVRDVLAGSGQLLAGLPAEAVIVDMSTIDPVTAQEMYSLARAHGVRYLDAPVSGGEAAGSGTDGARSAALSFMVGGDDDAFEQALPVLEMLGRRFYHLGPAGAGSTVKLISNLIAGLHNLVAAEAFVLGAALNITPRTLLEVFKGTDAKSYWMMNYFARRLRSGDYQPGFSVALQLKDHRLAQKLGEDAGVELTCNRVALQLYGDMLADGRGNNDLVDAVRFLAERESVGLIPPPGGPVRLKRTLRRQAT
jgi:3-hydroxyisobutyrate dehydrogenase-like beta-hydroxyacid dehydrogenase